MLAHALPHPSSLENKWMKMFAWRTEGVLGRDGGQGCEGVGERERWGGGGWAGIVGYFRIYTNLKNALVYLIIIFPTHSSAADIWNLSSTVNEGPSTNGNWSSKNTAKELTKIWTASKIHNTSSWKGEGVMSAEILWHWPVTVSQSNYQTQQVNET